MQRKDIMSLEDAKAELLKALVTYEGILKSRILSSGKGKQKLNEMKKLIENWDAQKNGDTKKLVQAIVDDKNYSSGEDLRITIRPVLLNVMGYDQEYIQNKAKEKSQNSFVNDIDHKNFIKAVEKELLKEALKGPLVKHDVTQEFKQQSHHKETLFQPPQINEAKEYAQGLANKDREDNLTGGVELKENTPSLKK